MGRLTARGETVVALVVFVVAVLIPAMLAR